MKNKMIAFFEERIQELKKEKEKRGLKFISLHLIENSIMINEKLLEEAMKKSGLILKDSDKIH